ncbi:DUF1206 domain-containing protein [Leisingera aquaemixtae]|uniref:DUF1206 domain-containing protein n=1 Tax=Leisingera aquaemixtae TaxID=1396826 RepID=A0ABY5WKQ5_9RHOB|nr:DUF1206 domain-containing protein [Leisingera aquaemixtae]UWQ42024.1 DUF1206 domain-containing protein [Leisingera aquaemixtae]
MTSDSFFTDARRKRLQDVDPADFAWAVPVMRTGYAGRALVYLAVAGVSLRSIWEGGEAKGTAAALEWLQGGWGTAVIILITIGLFAYAVWRMVDSFWDLEAYGSGAKGLIARAGMIVTGLIHLGLGILALSVLTGSGEAAEGGGGLSGYFNSAAGKAALGIAGILTIGAGGYYIRKAWKETYRNHLRANPVTLHLNSALKAGLAAHGVVIAIIGFLILQAALSASGTPEAGIGTAFDWLHDKVYGRILVTVLCVGLLGFALFCLVNALYRIVPKASDSGTETLRAALDKS